MICIGMTQKTTTAEVQIFFFSLNLSTCVHIKVSFRQLFVTFFDTIFFASDDNAQLQQSERLIGVILRGQTLDRTLKLRETAEKLSIGYGTVQRHLQQLDYLFHFDIWVPHKLPEENLSSCSFTYNSLLKWHESDPFLKRIGLTTKNTSSTQEAWEVWGPVNSHLHPKKIFMSCFLREKLSLRKSSVCN